MTRTKTATAGTLPGLAPTKPRTAWRPPAPSPDTTRATRCPRCRATVLEAHADGVYPVRVEPVLLTPLAELAVLVAAGDVFRLWPDPRKAPRMLAARHAEHITARPGEGLTRHMCGVNLGAPDPMLLAGPAASHAWPQHATF